MPSVCPSTGLRPRHRRPALLSLVMLALALLLAGAPVASHAGDPPSTWLWLPVLEKNWDGRPAPLVGQPEWLWAAWDHPIGDGHRIVDWDGDGQNEIMVTWADYEVGAPRVLIALRHSGGYNFEEVWATGAGAGWGLDDLDGDGKQEIWVLERDGRLVSYRPGSHEATPAGELVRPENQVVVTALSADLTGPGQPTLLVGIGPTAHATDLAAYRLPDLQLLWKHALIATTSRLQVAQVDDDPQLEILTSTCMILDGASGGLEWTYVGFGKDEVATGDIDGDGRDEVASLICQYDEHGYDVLRLAVYDVEARAAKWQASYPVYTYNTIAMADANGDDVSDILLGNGGGTIAIVDASSRTLLWDVQSPYSASVVWMAVGDADNDGEPDIVWINNVLHVTPSGDTTARYTAPQFSPPFRVYPLQMDADPAWELVIFEGNVQGTSYQVLDSATGRPEDGLNLELDSLPWTDYQPPLAAQLDADPWPELLASVGQDFYALDHDGTRLAKATFDEELTPVWAGDVDGDGQIEVVTHSSKRVAIHRLDTLAYEWQSIAFSQGVSDAAVADVDGDGHVEIVFHGANSFLQAYDGTTHLLRWQMPPEQHVARLAIGDADGDGRPELATFEPAGSSPDAQPGDVRIYDGATRQLLGQGAHIDDDDLVYQVAFLPLAGTPYLQLAVVTNSAAFLFRSAYDTQPTQVLDARDGRWTVADLDGDGYTDLLAGYRAGVLRYRALSPGRR